MRLPVGELPVSGCLSLSAEYETHEPEDGRTDTHTHTHTHTHTMLTLKNISSNLNISAVMKLFELDINDRRDRSSHPPR